MRRRTIILSALLAMALFASPTSANVQPTLRSETVYFHCPGPTKAHQANYVAGALSGGSFANWNATAPTQSASEGAGCGGLDWGGTTNPFYDPMFKGEFTGNLKTMTVRIHNLLLGNATSGATESLRIWGDIDGVPIFPASGRAVQVTPVVNSNGSTEMYEFTITNIGIIEDITDENGNVIGTRTGGAVTETGDGTQVRTITLGIGLNGTNFGGDPAGHKAGALVWDTTEVPGGITFNPAAPAAATLAADLPE